MRNAYKILAEMSEGNSLLARPRHRWDNINIDHKYCQMAWFGFISLGAKSIGGLF
jgi:hypothetical protein